MRHQRATSGLPHRLGGVSGGGGRLVLVGRVGCHGGVPFRSSVGALRRISRTDHAAPARRIGPPMPVGSVSGGGGCVVPVGRVGCHEASRSGRASVCCGGPSVLDWASAVVVGVAFRLGGVSGGGGCPVSVTGRQRSRGSPTGRAVSARRVGPSVPGRRQRSCVASCAGRVVAVWCVGLSVPVGRGAWSGQGWRWTGVVGGGRQWAAAGFRTVWGALVRRGWVRRGRRSRRGGGRGVP